MIIGMLELSAKADPFMFYYKVISINEQMAAFLFQFQVYCNFEMKLFPSVTTKPLKNWRIIQMTPHLGKGRQPFILHFIQQEKIQCNAFVAPL